MRPLERYDVDTIFGIPGVHTRELQLGLCGTKIRHVTSRDEQDTCFMADGYASTNDSTGQADQESDLPFLRLCDAAFLVVGRRAIRPVWTDPGMLALSVAGISARLVHTAALDVSADVGERVV